MAATGDAADVGTRARRRAALRLLPFVFLLYVVNYVDRINVSFANLTFNADLGFIDRVYGFGVGVFYVSYILLEIPGAFLNETTHSLRPAFAFIAILYLTAAGAVLAVRLRQPIASSDAGGLPVRAGARSPAA